MFAAECLKGTFAPELATLTFAGQQSAMKHVHICTPLVRLVTVLREPFGKNRLRLAVELAAGVKTCIIKLLTVKGKQETTVGKG